MPWWGLPAGGRCPRGCSWALSPSHHTPWTWCVWDTCLRVCEQGGWVPGVSPSHLQSEHHVTKLQPQMCVIHFSWFGFFPWCFTWDCHTHNLKTNVATVWQPFPRQMTPSLTRPHLAWEDTSATLQTPYSPGGRGASQGQGPRDVLCTHFSDP